MSTPENNTVGRNTPIDQLKPNPLNPREHSDEQIALLARNIEKFGFQSTIQVDENGMILAGHCRVLALQKLNRTEVPVQVMDGLTETDKCIYWIGDNKIPELATWGQELLNKTIEKLEKEAADLGLTGLSPQEIDRALADLAPEQGWTEEDEIPSASPMVITRPGDLWILDKHRLLCGDATSTEAVEKVLGGALADMVFCDPPYSVAYTGKTARKLTIVNDDLGAGFYGFLLKACTNILAVTKGAVYICMSSSELHTLHRAFTDAGGHWSTFLIWAKDRFTLGHSDYQRQFEPILYGWKEGQSHYWIGARNEGDVWFVPKPKSNRLHPTMKPVALAERAIRNSSRRGDLILDIFAGAGSTLIACEKASRRAAVLELDAKYSDVIVRRWEAYTHREAKLLDDGRTFSAISTERARRAA
jgi:DNA modification methylase